MFSFYLIHSYSNHKPIPIYTTYHIVVYAALQYNGPRDMIRMVSGMKVLNGIALNIWGKHYIELNTDQENVLDIWVGMHEQKHTPIKYVVRS